MGMNSTPDIPWVILSPNPNVEVPDFPLPDPRDREIQYWEKLWGTPQAAEWDRLGLVLSLAQYVRMSIDLEMPNAPAPALAVWRQYADSLGITITGLRKNRWKVAEDKEPGPPRSTLPRRQGRGYPLVSI